MPVIFAVPDVIALNQWGKFVAVTPPGFTIPAANAVSVEAADTGGWLTPYNRNLNLYVPVTIPIPEGWAAVVERFNWGDSHKDARLFYEVWQEPGELAPYMIEEKFHCCGVLTAANEDNRCVPPGTLVMSNPSLKPMEEFKVGDLVLTKEGTYRRVTKTYKDPFNGNLVSIKAYHLPEMKVTPNHKVWASKGNGFSWTLAKDLEIGDKIILSFPDMEQDIENLRTFDYIDTKDLTVEGGKVYGGHRFGRRNPKARPIPEYIPISKDFLRIAGYYLAEGCTTPQYIKFGFNVEEKEYVGDVILTMKKLFNLPATVYPRANSKGVEIQFGCVPLARLFKALFSTGAHNKRVPHFFLHLPEEKLKELVKGYFRGDGSNTSKGGQRVELDSVSIDLASQLRLILLRMGIVTSFRKDNNSRGFGTAKSKIFRLYADGYPQLARYIFGTAPVGKKRPRARKAYIEGNHLITPIYKIDQIPYSGPVYNIEVEEDHSYNLLGGVVSNSTHPSAATKLEFRIWNRSLTVAEFPAAVDAYCEISGWVYLFRIEFLDEILKTSKEADYKRLDKYFNDLMEALGALRGAPIPTAPRAVPWR